MGFRKQLAVGIGALTTVTILICAIAIATLTITSRNSSRLMRQTVEELGAVHALDGRAERLVAAARGYLLTGDPLYRARFAVLRVEIDDSLAALERVADTSEVELSVRAVTNRLRDYSRAVDAAVRDRGLVQDLPALEQLFELRLAPRREAMEAAIVSLVDAERSRLELAADSSWRLVRLAEIALLVACALAISLSVALAFVVARKLTNQYRRVQEATRTAEAAAASRKELIDIVSHDLRSPLGAILLGVDVVRTEQGDIHALAPIESAARQMNRLVEDLLDAARAENRGLELDKKPCRPAELLQRTVELFEARANRAHVHLRTECRAVREFSADAERVLQVLANLVGNAFKVSNTGGEIAIRACDVPGGIRLEVEDHGPGIPAAEIDKIFSAYSQGSTAGSGRATLRGTLGLGLYIARTLVEAHGGRIGVASHLGHGSTFWFELPRGSIRDQRRNLR